MQIHGIPPFNMKVMVARKIKSLTGQVLKVDQSGGRDCIGRFLWVKIRMDVSLPLMRGIFMGFLEEGAKWVDFRYEYLLEYCSHCGCLGHPMSSIRSWGRHQEKYGIIKGGKKSVCRSGGFDEPLRLGVESGRKTTTIQL